MVCKWDELSGHEKYDLQWRMEGLTSIEKQNTIDGILWCCEIKGFSTGIKTLKREGALCQNSVI